MTAKLDNLYKKSTSAPIPFSLRNEIATKSFNRSAEAVIPEKIEAYVLESYPRIGVCKISYYLKGVKTIDWAKVEIPDGPVNNFPTFNSKVLIEVENQKPIIKKRILSDWNQYYANQKTPTDSLPYGDSSVGYRIMPGANLD